LLPASSRDGLTTISSVKGPIPMPESSRRNFLIASGTGAAAVGVAAALPGTASAQARTSHAKTSQSTPLSNPRNAEALVAHVGDPSTGTLSLFVGDREIVLHDPDLVARLTRAAALEA
jgi:hypothetical protein